MTAPRDTSRAEHAFANLPLGTILMDRHNWPWVYVGRQRNTVGGILTFVKAVTTLPVYISPVIYRCAITDTLCRKFPELPAVYAQLNGVPAPERK